MQLNAIFPVLAGMPPPVADLYDASSDTRDITFRGDSRHVERLPSLTHLRRVWCLKTRPAFLPILTSCTQLNDLYLEQLSTSDLRFVEAFEQLNILRLDGATRVTDFRPLARLKTLRGLGIQHFPRVQTLEPLAELTGLISLEVSGSVWTRMSVESLEPVGRLTSLRFLALTNLEARDASLAPLARLTSLEELSLANFYPVEEMARLSAALPATSCDWFRPFLVLGWQSCKACGGELLMPTGKGKRTFCAQCNPLRREKLEAEWNALRRSA